MKPIDIICFGDSDYWYHNHGHMDMQLVKRYANQGRVLYINSVVMRKFNVSEGTMFLKRLKRKLASIKKGIVQTDIQNFTVYSPFTMPVHHIPIARKLNQKILAKQVKNCITKLNFTNPIVWVACPAAAPTAISLPSDKLIYQRSDRYEDLPGIDVQQAIKYDQMLKSTADLVIFANKELYHHESSQCNNAIYLDHGVDYEFFAQADQDQTIPDDIKQIPHPILGFYGNIDDHTSDISLIEKNADILQDFSIVLIGSASSDITALTQKSNVYHLGQKPYAEIPDYAKCFDVCFMPWQQNDWIAACNPIKLKEYLALGKPIVSTPFNELQNYNGLVATASNPNDFALAVRKQFATDSAEKSDLRKQRVAPHSWDAKAAKVLEILYKEQKTIKQARKQKISSTATPTPTLTTKN